MTLVTVTGDVCTTTTVALAAAWPADDALLVEADATGGDLAAWFDLPATPSLSTLVAHARRGSRPAIARHVQQAPNGLRLIPAPAHAVECRQAVHELGRSLVGPLAADTVIADAGRPPAGTHPLLTAADVTVVVHRQATQSPRAAAVRLRRFAEQLDGVGASALVVAVVGSAPFGIDEVAQLVADVAGPTPVVELPVDGLAAAVLGGRTGVSARRLARLPLLRAAGNLVATVAETAPATPSAPATASVPTAPAAPATPGGPDGPTERRVTA